MGEAAHFLVLNRGKEYERAMIFISDLEQGRTLTPLSQFNKKVGKAQHAAEAVNGALLLCTQEQLGAKSV